MTIEKQQSSTAGASVKITVEVNIPPKLLGVVNMLVKVGKRIIPILLMHANLSNQPKIDHPQLPPPIEHQDQ